jgi:hypothetical protein
LSVCPGRSVHTCACTVARLACFSFIDIATNSFCTCAAKQQFLKLKTTNLEDASSVCFVFGGFDKNTTILELNDHDAPLDMPLQTRDVADFFCH